MSRLPRSPIAALVALAVASSSACRAADAVAGAVFEAAFTTTKAYASPFADVEVDVVFACGDRTWKVPAFWAGGDTWKARFVPPAAGDYRYRVVSTDPRNADFAGPERTLAVGPAAEGGVGRRFLRVAADRRHFERTDGSPFLWLGDTWWKCLSKRMSFDDFRTLAADRKAKGFNVVQIVCGPYPDEAMMEPRWENEGGMPYLDKAFTAMNPRYFEFADRRIEHLVECGFVPAIAGGWGRPQHGGRSTLDQVGLAGFKRHWRHLVARYGCLPVVWIVGGEAQDAYGPWGELAAYVRAIDPCGHPLCYHAPGDPRAAIADNAACDFDMVAIGHDGLATVAQTREMLKACRACEPERPVVCGEACYERHMQTNFEDVQRHMFWSFMLSGAAGHTYGAAGIWQASVEGDPGIEPVYDLATWREGMGYPGAEQVGLGRKLLETLPWWRFDPHPEWAEPDCVAAGIPGEIAVVYRPKRGIYDWTGPVVKGLAPDGPWRAFYWDPARGTRFDHGVVTVSGGEFRAPRLPSPQDWVLVMERRR